MYILQPAAMSMLVHQVHLVLNVTTEEHSENDIALNALVLVLRSICYPGSPDYKPDDPEYKALRAHASTTLEAFSQFLSTPAAIELVWKVDNVFYVLRNHGEEAGLLSPPLIRAMSGYLDDYEKARGKLPGYLAWKAEWIRTLYRNLKPDDSGQVRPFDSACND